MNLPHRDNGNQAFSFLALTPPGLTDPAIAVAASRNGGIGVLDLEYCHDASQALAAVVKLAHHTQGSCGLKLDSSAEDLLTRLAAHLPPQVEAIILTPAAPEALQRQVARFGQQGRRVLLEVTGEEEALSGVAAGVAGLIAKGHEAGGRVGEETAFVLLQRLLARFSLPVWVHGGIGLHTVAACYAAGAAGVVLDAQLWLARESPLAPVVKESLGRMDGSETLCLGAALGERYRVYARPGLSCLQALQAQEARLLQSPSCAEQVAAWRQAIRSRVGWGDPDHSLWLLGQDAAFAAPLAQRFRTVGGILAGLRQAITSHVRTAKTLLPLAEGAPLAHAHGTRYPIVQGPMTRVSDRAEFALKVAEAGGLPFLALALLRAAEVEALLAETRQRLGSRPWGVGILGFVPAELRQEQLGVIRTYRPPLALIAGGRPDQARRLEDEGIATYLHVPSPGLLKLFLDSGARRFVFEGRECGGHVGPRSSFVLWESMIEVLLQSLATEELAQCHVLFAGGIHDARSAAMVAVMAAPLAERGVRCGVLLGTAYLFTTEAVATGAITREFQEVALRCAQTVLLETGPGHATRCALTPYVEVFQQEKRRLLARGLPPEEVRNALEALNLGRLRLAAKGLKRLSASAPLLPVSAEELHAEGMFMIGQVAALRDQTCTLDQLHAEVATQSSDLLRRLPEPAWTHAGGQRQARPCDVAIVGMACLLPKAPDLQTYWENILNKVDAITEIPPERWDWRAYFDPDRHARDKIYSKWGGFLDPIPFDPARYGMPPKSLASIEPLQLLTLEVVRKALEDAGYGERPFPKERTAVILGVGGGAGDLGQQYAVRASLPLLLDAPAAELWQRLPEWTEDSFPGILLNVTAGRVANRFDLGGVNYTVDAACASSLAAVYLAARELEDGTSDMVLVGGADTVQNPFAYLCFSKTQALSPRGRCRAFDASADGIVISEGIAILVLKRLEDAERDGDRIYAVIKAVAGSSDGRDRGLTAPRPEGQRRALERAYAKAGFSPATVGLIEAHGTGTVAGDRAEIETLKGVFEAAGAAPQRCAIGSVKSMIGHTKCTAGVAGLIKVALALYHKVLPPTLHVERPNPILHHSPFYVNTEARPWLREPTAPPRRAGVSAFGFGGTNFHAVLEEYTGTCLEPPAWRRWPGELLLWRAETKQALDHELASLEQALEKGAKPELAALACTVWQQAKGRSGLTLALVVTSLDDLRQKLAQARAALARPEPCELHDPRGLYFTEKPLAQAGMLAFLFPGQGSQYVNMLRELALAFPEVREAFELADQVLAGRFPQPLSRYVFPPPAFSPDEEQAQQQALTQTQVAQPALGAAEMGLLRLLHALGVVPHLVAGHSYGEYVALCAAGVFSEETLYTVSEARGRFIVEGAGHDLGTMAAVQASREQIEPLVQDLEGVWIANLNAPSQTLLSGTRSGIQAAVQRLQAQGIGARPVPVACAFHSPIVAPARDRLAAFLATVPFAPPRCPVFANASAAPYPDEPEAIRAVLCDHLVQPVAFAREIEAMYAHGARLFLEVGPRTVLSGLVRQILAQQPHLAVALDVPGRSGLLQLLHAVGQLAAHGLPLQLDRLYQGRVEAAATLEALLETSVERPLPPTVWLVDGGRAWPLRQAAPRSAASTAARESTRMPPETPTSVPPRSAAIPAPAPLPSPTPANGAAPVPDDPASRVMLEFHQLMHRFLETQQQVMLAYLRATTDGIQAMGTATGTPEAAVVPPAPTPSPASNDRLAPVPAAVDTASPSPAPVAPPPAPAAPEAGEAALKQALLQIVSDRTGYPLEMLDLDANLEADLGIDSIKRVEILGALQSTCFPAATAQFQEALEELTRIKTLRGLLTRLSAFLEAPAPAAEEPLVPPCEAPGPIAAPLASAAAASPAAPHTEPQTREHAAQAVPRFVLTTVDAPRPAASLQLPPGAVFLLTEDGFGIAGAVAQALRQGGAQPVRVRPGSALEEVEPGLYTADLAKPEAVREFVAHLRQRHGPLVGILHLLPLQPPAADPEADLARWQARLDLEVKGLFFLVQAASADLCSHAAGKRWVVAATAMGGAFASTPTSHPFFPGQGGIAGLLKTLALEWPAVHCKVVDCQPTAVPASALAECLLGEMAANDGEVEVGYQGKRRLVLRPSLAPLKTAEPITQQIDASWVILVTGGARGITAEVACELARRYQPTLLIVGRSPLPEAAEPPELATLSTPQDVKAALLERLRRSGQATTPAQLEAAYQQLCRAREMRRNLEAMRQAGARVHYYQVDVRDAAAFGALLEDLYRQHGRLDGVIHGAGVIEDKRVEDKTAASFARVFETKVNSALVLSQHLRPASLRFLVFFSSIAGRFGNAGQSDYAAANEVLNKLALFLDRRWPGRVVAVNWGPWDDTGMVAPHLRRHFAARGVQLIPAAVGRHLLDAELTYGHKGEAEVILGDGPWARVEAQATAPAPLPLLNGSPAPKGGGIELSWRLDPGERYLQDHRLDGKPVFPMAMAVELMAEAVQQGWPEWEIVAIRSLRVLRGIVLENGARALRVLARPQTAAPSLTEGTLEVDVELYEEGLSRQPSYRATAVLADRLPAPPPNPCAGLAALQPFPLTVAEAYRQWLFHGPCFQGISAIEGISERGMVALLLPSTPAQCLLRPAGDRWLIDPVLLDCGLQLAILWQRAHHDMTPLPSRFATYRRFGLPGEGPVRCCLQARTDAGGHVLVVTIAFLDPAGRLLGLLEEMEFSCSKALNRLAAAAAVGQGTS